MNLPEIWHTGVYKSKKNLGKEGWSMANRGLGLRSGCACWDGCAPLTTLVRLAVSAGTHWPHSWMLPSEM